MRLKQNIVMIILLLALLATMTLGLSTVDKKQEVIDNPQEVIEEKIPESFCKSIKNADTVPSDVLDVITNYMDDYYLSLYNLELIDTTKYFSNEIEGRVSDLAIKFTVDSRLQYDFDFTMSDAYYTLNITKCNQIDNKYYIDFLEDDYMYFKFLDGISSEAYDIENSIVIEKVNDEYKISEYDKTQGYYMMFKDNMNEDLDAVYDMYYKELSFAITRENKYKQEAQTSPYVSDKTYKTKYDRDAASKYAQTYYHNRNDEWYDFSEEGNCQNFASQALLAGGMRMDYDGYDDDNDVWYYNNNGDYSSTWTGVPYFRDFCKEDDSVLVADADINIYYAEPGDIIQVGISSVTHTTIVSRIVNGHILLNSNSIDMKDFPLEAYTYPVRKLIKILGSN